MSLPTGRTITTRGMKEGFSKKCLALGLTRLATITQGCNRISLPPCLFCYLIWTFWLVAQVAGVEKVTPAKGRTKYPFGCFCLTGQFDLLRFILIKTFDNRIAFSRGGWLFSWSMETAREEINTQLSNSPLFPFDRRKNSEWQVAWNIYSSYI